jgi:hypothetical protein
MITTNITHETLFTLFKKYDYRISILLILTSPFLLITFEGGAALFYAYFIVGGWHIFSMLIHFIYTVVYKRQKLSKHRSIYHWVIVILTAILILGGYFLLFFLLIAAPIMAIVYTMLCYEEAKK